jgi:hypothetical protein
MTKAIYGNLKFKDGFIISDPNPNDVGLRINTNGFRSKEMLIISNAHTGIQIRNKGAEIDSAFITGVACDSVQSWCDDWIIKLLIVDDSSEYKYSDQCHKDVVQMFSAKSVKSKYQLNINQPVRNIIIRRANILVRGEDKGGFIASEIGGVEGSQFFSNGIKFDTDSQNPYLFSAERVSQVSFGSHDSPLVSSDISNKTIRIGNIKMKEARCGTWSVYCNHDGINLELSDSARASLKLIKVARWI